MNVFLSETGVDERGIMGTHGAGVRTQATSGLGPRRRGETAGVEGIPGGNEDINLVGVGQEGAHGLWLAGEIKERRGLLRASIDIAVKADSRNKDWECMAEIHHPRSLVQSAKRMQ